MTGLPGPDSGEFRFIEPLLDLMAAHEDNGRPFVTLCYAQSLDGSIAVERSHACRLSSEPSLRLTHFLRSRHDALLVGINTILADDPQLTVRLCAGSSPRPVVLDKTLRLPCEARMLRDPSRRPLIVATVEGASDHRRRLLEHGAQVLVSPLNADGLVDLAAALRLLQAEGLRSIMVEGGGSVITHFLKERLVDYCVITIAPKLIGGFKAVNELCLRGDQAPVSIRDCGYHALGGDLIAFGPLEQA